MVFSKESLGKLSPSDSLNYYVERISGDEPGLVRNGDSLVVITIPASREACVVVNDRKAAVQLLNQPTTMRSWKNIMDANCKKVEMGNRVPFGDAKVDAVVLQKLGELLAP